MSQDKQRRPCQNHKRSTRAGNGTHHLTEEMAKRMGISVRQAYRITAALNRSTDRQSEQHALLARYVLLEVADPGYANALTEFLDGLLHTLIEEAAPAGEACLNRRWGQTAGRHVAAHMNRAAQLREQRLNDSLELPW